MIEVWLTRLVLLPLLATLLCATAKCYTCHPLYLLLEYTFITLRLLFAPLPLVSFSALLIFGHVDIVEID
eukprot:m.257450 g.257450  ORF g.257450 m.257450 type:complete len:70 (+) comp15529_c1_seq1:2070-2279(+)